MPSFLSKFRSFKPHHHTQHPAPAAEQVLPKPATPDWIARRTFSISPKLCTFFDFEPITPSPTKPTYTPYRPANPTPHTALGVLDSPQSPESVHSGVAGQILDVEIVRRVSKGKVKRIELAKVKTYEAACAGTQTSSEDVSVGARAKTLLQGPSLLAWNGWEMLHSGDAGLLFMGSGGPAKTLDPLGGGRRRAKDSSSPSSSALPLTGTLLLKLQRAIAADASLQVCQKRTAREIATLNSHQENLRKRKDALKARLQELKSLPAYELDDEKVAVDKELVRVWEASIDTMDEGLRSEERSEVMRDAVEGLARGALAVLALRLRERGLLDVVDGQVGRRGSEVEFEGRYRLV